jgi:ribonuclease Z
LKTEYPITIVEIDHHNNKLIEYEGLESDNPVRETPIKENIIFNCKKYTLKYTLVEHSVVSYAYSFIEKPRFGKFFPERAQELGIPESRIWKKLQEGKIIEYGGRKIDPMKERIIGPKRVGRKITYSGDTTPCESLIELGINSDILIHEATFSIELDKNAKETKHSTSIDAANIAQKMKAKQLILTHISSRYQEDAIKLLEDAKKIFPNTILAEDLLKITLK